LKQLALCGFIRIDIGPRCINAFSLADGWRALDAVEAKRRVELARLPKPQRQAAPKPPTPAPTPKSVKVEPRRTMQRATPSMPKFSWDAGDGR
jgi:hypothetical protein